MIEIKKISYKLQQLGFKEKEVDKVSVVIEGKYIIVIIFTDGDIMLKEKITDRGMKFEKPKEFLDRRVEVNMEISTLIGVLDGIENK